MKRYRAIAAYYDAEYQRHPTLKFDVPMLLKHIGAKNNRFSSWPRAQVASPFHWPRPAIGSSASTTPRTC